MTSRDARAALIRRIGSEIQDKRVLAAMQRVPRHSFMPGTPLRWAYADTAAPIGYGQTISQPTIVAIMSEALELDGRERVLEVGTGSGYQAAVLSLLAAEVYSIELVPELASSARARLERLGYANVHVRQGDGYQGWIEQAPFDRIVLTAAPPDVPDTLFDQLRDGGLLVAPTGFTRSSQRL
ncbi:MAG TPA: protein-L-isoaspartate(D-aspartate) O-methyltransferase, partial [Candidatus Tumulicola sp.]|nr:protein-L-isoaspartate(D-aspartate) O-methyltransferase [Candidatus Tumulicola sp.]